MRTSLLIALVALAGCVGAQDNPSTARDLRVLGMQFEPPEVLITRCNARSLQVLLASQADGGSIANVDLALLVELLGVASAPLDFKALVVDPRGDGRMLDYSLSVCTDIADRRCSNAERRSLVSTGQFSPANGEFTFRFSPVSEINDAGMPGQRTIANGTNVLIDVVQNDVYRGLGGIRIPIVLEVWAPDTGERIYAQKLMPYVCRFLPQMQQNVAPLLPGMTVTGATWDAGQKIQLSGRADIKMEPLDFSAFEETYVVPSLQLQPVTLVESWKIAHYATSGTMSPYETGGTNLAGGLSKSTFSWSPDSEAPAQDVTFYFVVRDGRGGESWITRQAHWIP